MKHWLLMIAIQGLSISAFSQREPTHKFNPENIFMGGSISLGLGSNSFVVGGNPEIGYSIAPWLDAGTIINLNYYYFSEETISQKSFNYGGGIFVRLYPIKEFFFTAIPEYNVIKTKLKSSYNGAEERFTEEAPSLLVGIGIGSRIIGDAGFYTLIAFDAGNNVNSPYISYYGRKLPIIRAGFTYYLHQGKK